MKFQYTLLAFFVCLGLSAQPPEFNVEATDAGALAVALEFSNADPPVAGMNDWVAFVDADDANILLGRGPAAQRNGMGLVNANGGINPPPSGSFHIVYWDSSMDLFQIVAVSETDPTPLTIPFADMDRDGFVDEAQLDFSMANPFLLVGSSVMPGNMDFQTIQNLLPVELTAFTGRIVAKRVQLDWSTASEQNNAYFDVERSNDGIAFEVIGRVRGANEAASYNYYDEQPTNDVLYYRLRQTDFDGSSNLSNVVRINLRNAFIGGLDVFPNPAANDVTVRLGNGWGQSVRIEVIDASGRVIQNLNGIENQASDLLLGELTSGVYYVRANDGKQVSSTKVIVK